MHEAFKTHAIGATIKEKIHSLDVWENNIYVGTGDGHVLLFHVEMMANTAGVEECKVFLEMRKFVGVGKKPIDQICVVEQIGKIIILCDGNVAVYDLSTLDLDMALGGIKGANVFAVNREPPFYELCVAVKKKLHVFAFVGSGGSTYFLRKDLVVPDSVSSLAYSGGKVYAGYKREYTIMDESSGQVTELFSIEGKLQSTSIAVVGQDEVVLAGEDVGVALDSSGLPTRGGINWKLPPVNLACCSGSFLLAQTSKGVDVFTLFDQKNVQAIQLPNGTCIASNDERIVAASKDRLLLLQPVAIHEQSSEMIRRGMVEDGLELFEQCMDRSEEDFETIECSIRQQAGLEFFRTLQFQAAVRQWKSGKTPPLEVMSMFPTCHVRGVDPSKEDVNSIVARAVKEEVDSGDGGADDDSAMICQLHVEEAKRSLAHFLFFIRCEPLGRNIVSVIDTALVRVLAELPDTAPKLARFLLSPNSARLEECERHLKQHGRHHARALLLRQHGQVDEALEVWKQLGSQKVIDAGHDGVADTVETLRGESSLSLVFKFSSWVLKKRPSEGVRIFTEPKEGVALPVAKVIDFLSDCGDQVYQQFLEHLVMEKNDRNPIFHTRLALFYVDSAHVLQRDQGPNVGAVDAGSETGGLGVFRSKLLQFLRNPDMLYDTTVLLERTAKTKLYLERVLLFRQSGQHEQALNTILNDMNDFDKAEAYCTGALPELFGPPLEDVTSVLMVLVAILVGPPPENGSGSIGVSARMDRAIEVLEKHADLVNPAKALEALPQFTPLNKLSKFIHSSLRSALHDSRQQSVVRQLSKVNNIMTMSELVETKSPVIRITRESNCHMCDKRIGDKAFAFLPDRRKVVHLKCYRDSEKK